ncbi:MAG TPA: hypothetical protein VK590_02015 [Saprospiraceae bacterium]|nr:hypothetical protein [Saprospiraceae bacterium]
MSLSDLISNTRKPWLHGRMEALRLDGNLEVDGSFVIGPTGSQHLTIGFTGAAHITTDANVQRIGNQVFLDVWGTTASAAGATGTIISTSALPVYFRPLNSVYAYTAVEDNTVIRNGSALIDINGIITLGVDLVSGGSVLPQKPFGSAGTIGFEDINASYTVRF